MVLGDRDRATEKRVLAWADRKETRQRLQEQSLHKEGNTTPEQTIMDESMDKEWQTISECKGNNAGQLKSLKSEV